MSDHGASTKPLLSVVIPAYNRASLIERAITSCLGQDFTDFEVIVVDDGSSDGTPDRVRRIDDQRVTLVLHNVNRGVCAAKNTGADAARGKWVLFLDSDDELLPGALRLIHQRIVHAPAGVSRLIFMYQLDAGGGSPNPPLREEVWNYEGFIRWASMVEGPTDYLNVVSKQIFKTVRFPDGKVAEPLFHLDFVSQFCTQAYPDVVGIVHSDATNRSKDFSIQTLIANASENAAALAVLLTRHGDALQRWGPTMYQDYLRGRMTALFLAGRRWEGLRIAAQILRRRVSLKILGIVFLGVLGPIPLAWLKIRMT